MQCALTRNDVVLLRLNDKEALATDVEKIKLSLGGPDNLNWIQVLLMHVKLSLAYVYNKNIVLILLV